MAVTFTDKVSSRVEAIKTLERLKEYEKTHNLHEKTIGKCTIRCKNEEQFDEFKEAIKNPKQW